jgi:hypothetical protein
VATPVTQPPGRWQTLSVDVIDASGKRVGGFTRNYSTLFRAFRPFTRGGHDFALYPPDYTATRVMSLPDCQDLGGEEPDTHGFCPVDYWVAEDPDLGLDGDFGLVAGCVWGDDSSWKIQFLDLSRVAEGVVVRDERLGYIELGDSLTLDEAVRVRRHSEFSDWPGHYLEIRTTRRIDVASGKPVPSYDV